MDLKEFLVANPTVNQELYNQLSFEDAVQLQLLLKSDQKIKCTFEVADNQGRIYILKGVNSDTVQAYRLIHNQDSAEIFLNAAKT